MRTAILALLRQHQGTYISGEEISRQLAVSRTAVWKHIQALKQDGYNIEAHSRLGYLLHQVTDLLLPDEIKPRLGTRYLGREIRYFNEIDSTNNEAKKWAAAGCPEGAIVIAESQITGRGRLARGWFSPKGQGIWMSVVLRPPFSPREAPKCTMLAAVAVNRAIQASAKIACGIKWPNDILHNGKKLVGILTEMSAEIDAINYVIIGMGINVNIAEHEFPPELKATATSVASAAGHPVSRVELLINILEQLEQAYEQVIDEGFEPLLAEWRKQSITLGRMVNVIGVKQEFSGLAVDIDADGALIVRTGDKEEHVFAGDVSIRPQNLWRAR